MMSTVKAEVIKRNDRNSCLPSSQKEKRIMFGKSFSAQGKLSKRLAPMVFAAAALLLAATSTHAQDSCKNVVGHYEEHAVQTGCTSPVGLCIAGEYHGVLKGAFEGYATTLSPIVETPPTGALTFTSNSVIHAKIGGKSGNLMIKNAGVYLPAGGGHIVDLQVIVGGDGDLTGATGAIRASGVFDGSTGTGESEYMGSICLP
jgi:hypothetical protein